MKLHTEFKRNAAVKMMQNVSLAIKKMRSQQNALVTLAIAMVSGQFVF